MSVTLSKIPGMGTGTESTPVAHRLPPVGAPLHDHREGIRANDMTVLHSALWILAVRGGTVHLAPIPGSVDRNGDIVPLWCAPLG